MRELRTLELFRNRKALKTCHLGNRNPNIDVRAIAAAAVTLGSNCQATGYTPNSAKLSPELAVTSTVRQCILNSTLPSTFSVIGEPWLNEINELRWFLC